MRVSPYWKAIVAAVAAAVGSIGTAMQEDSTITQAEAITALLVGLAALGAVWRVPNRAPSNGEDTQV